MSRGKLSPEFLQEIKNKVNLLDVVSEHVVLKRSGANASGLCPFHSERSPSFSVSEQKQLYHCYGCKKGGDLLSFVMEIHNLTFPEAVEELANRAKIPLPAAFTGVQPGETEEARQRREAAQQRLALAYKLNRFAAAFFHHALSNTSHIREYLNSRGVMKGHRPGSADAASIEGSPDLVREFYLGAAPASWDALSTHLVDKKAPVQVAVDLGLIRPSTREGRGGPGYFDLFRNRAMFPILDTRGRVAGFGGRSLPLPPGAPDVGGESPKYMNSPESLVFQKSKLLYGLYQAQKHIREKDCAILVEGYFDVLGLHSAGIRNAVATCGTSLTPEHLSLLKRLGSRIVILFDGDRAGITATERAMELGLEHGLVLYGAKMPVGLDPDELVLKSGGTGPAEMQGILEAAQPILDERIDELMRTSQGSSEERTQALKKVAQWLSRFRDPVGREVRIESLTKRFQLPRSLLEKAMPSDRTDRTDRREASGSVNVGSQNPPGSRPPNGLPRPSRSLGKAKQNKDVGLVEKILLGALARGGKFSDIFAQSRDKLPPKLSFFDLFDYFPARQFVESLLKDPGRMEHFRALPGDFLEAEPDSQVRSILVEALVTSDPPFTEEEVRHALNHRLAILWARFSQQIKAAIAQAEANKDAGLQSGLMKDYLDVQRKMKEFRRFYDEA